VRIVSVAVIAVVAAAAYLVIYGNASSALRNGCFDPYPDLRPVDGNVHFQGFPPRFVCLYRTKDGRVVERPN